MRALFSERFKYSKCSVNSRLRLAQALASCFAALAVGAPARAARLHLAEHEVVKHAAYCKDSFVYTDVAKANAALDHLPSFPQNSKNTFNVFADALKV